MTVIRAIPGRIRFELGSENSLVSLQTAIKEKISEFYTEIEWQFNSRTGRGLALFPSCVEKTSDLKESLTQTFPTLENTDDTALVVAESEGVVEEEKLDNPIWLVTKQVAKYYINRAFTPMYLRPYFLAWDVMTLMLKGVKALWNRKLNVDVLDAAAIGSAMAMRDFDTAGVINLLLNVGESLEEWTKEKSRRDLSELFSNDGKPVWVLRNEEEVLIPLQDVIEQDIVIVRSGTQIPVDGVVLDGRAMVNQSSMTGEPLALEKTEGDVVYAGTVLEEGKLSITAEAVGNATRFSKIAQAITDSDHLKAEIHSRAESMADKIVPFSFILAGVIFAFTRNWVKAGSVLMADYSCAIKLATPLTVRSAMLDSAKSGALLKGGKYVEQLAEIDAVVLDKTGTLTEAHPKVTDVFAVANVDREFVLRTAACLGEHFPHPVANTIVSLAEAEGLSHPEDHTEPEYILAHGIASTLEGERVLLGSWHFICEDEQVNPQEAEEYIASCAAQGLSTLYLAIGGKLVGVIALEDPLRASAPRFLQRLENSGMKRVIMLTGDNEATATSVARQLGIEEYYAQVLPQDKHDLIEKLQGEGYKVAMIGDGINDSVALAKADVGVCMKHGADIARETCNMVLTGERLDSFVDAMNYSRGAMRQMKGSFTFIVASNTAFIAGGILGFIPTAVIALLHNASTIATCAYSMRSRATI